MFDDIIYLCLPISFMRLFINQYKPIHYEGIQY